MSTPDTVISAAEAGALFSDLEDVPALLLAVSGGPDSTALMVLAARWAKALRRGPVLIAVTVDHGLRQESRREAADVARLAKKLGIAHRTLRWTGAKPKTGLPQAARHARYRLLADAARKAGALHVLTAHTLDDQAETVIIRLLRGSGMTGLSAMQRVTALPGAGDVALVRPLLGIPKTRLIATLETEKIQFADDPTNRDAKYTRARLRGLMPQLAREGLDAGRLALLARRLKRADAAIEVTVDRAKSELMLGLGEAPGMVAFDAAGFAQLPAEIALRLLGRAVGAAGDEGPVELAKLEALQAALDIAQKTGDKAAKSFRRSLAGSIVTLGKGKIVVDRAPPRRPVTSGARGKALTKRRPKRAKGGKTR